MRLPSQTRLSTICYVLSCTVFVATVYLPQIANARARLWFAGHETGNMDEWWAPAKAGVEHDNCDGSRNAKVHITVENRANGSMYVRVCQGRDSGGRCCEQNSRNLPVAQWFHLEAYYVKSIDSTGRVILWQDGTQIVDATDVDTANSQDLQWAVISYGTALDPSDNTIYVDDVMISKQ
jgi:hypothetical protein